MIFIARFLPSLIPGLGAFLNPTVLIVAGVALVAAFAAGVHWEAVMFAEFRGAVKAVGEAQEQRTRDRIARDRLTKEDIDRDYQTRQAALLRTIDGMSRWLPVSNSHRSVLPGNPPGAVSPDRIAFDRAELDTALREFIGGTEGAIAAFADQFRAVAGEGETLKLKLDTAIAWNAEIRR